MRRILLAGAALLGLIGVANAADLPRPAPAPVMAPAIVPNYSWTGFYVGVGWGYGMWDMNSSVVVPAGSIGTTNNGGRGWLGQVTAGYDYQFAVANWNLVAGVFADYDFGNLTGTSNFQFASAVFNTLTGVEKERSYWAAGARIGWLITPQILTYFNGGYTQAHFDGMTLTPLAGAGPLSTPSNTYKGWFTGGGVETQMTSIPGLFFNTEYRFANYRSATLAINSGAVVPGPGTPVSLKLEPHVQTVMSGIRYKFNWH